MKKYEIMTVYRTVLTRF